MKKLHLIQPIIEQLTTHGSKPIKVMANDENIWYCKYKDNNILFNELLAYHFAKIWNINIPECALISIDYDKYVAPFEDKRFLQKNFFDKECFGSQALEDAFEVNNAIINKQITQKIINKEDFLKIALFDIWLANDDRNANNYNLLLAPTDKGFMLLYVIDHADIFNTSAAYRYKIYELTEDDTVLNSNLATVLFRKNSGFVLKVNDVITDFYNNVKLCEAQLPTILAKVPDNWKIDIPMYEKAIRNIFETQWLDSCEKTFRTYTQIF